MRPRQTRQRSGTNTAVIGHDSELGRGAPLDQTDSKYSSLLSPALVGSSAILQPCPSATGVVSCPSFAGWAPSSRELHPVLFL